jgi:hypothetical protein
MPTLQIEYVEADVPDIFADAAGRISVSSGVVRIEFTITRLDEAPAGEQLTGKRYPVSRLALPLDAAIGLHQRLGQMLSSLQKEGILKRTNPSAP